MNMAHSANHPLRGIRITFGFSHASRFAAGNFLFHRHHHIPHMDSIHNENDTRQEYQKRFRVQKQANEKECICMMSMRCSNCIC